MSSLRVGSFAALLGLLASALAMLAPSHVAGLRHVAEAANRRHKVTYCTRHHHPRGCVAVPRSAKRPKKISQQGSAALTPPDVENGGGLGGGPGNHRATALAWARTQRNVGVWAWRCERFVEEAYGTRGRYATAAAAAASLDLHREPITAAPPGSLVYFAADKYNQRYGHVGLSTGGGNMISALTKVTITNVARTPYWRQLYLGWADAPATWPGRIPPPPGPTTFDPELAVRVTAPAFGQTVSGKVTLVATAPGASGVAFDAYYASDPRDAATREWHPLGNATQQGDSWAFDWDTAAVPDQGYGPWGTVNVAATALDPTGARTGSRDYRRVSIDNNTGSKEPPGTTTPVPRTYAETTGGVTHTWTNYTNAGGTEGATIPSNTTVQITCALQGFRVADGNTWWYRIASSPWSNAYHASADAFYNNGQTSGSLQGTPFVDPAVPLCP